MEGNFKKNTQDNAMSDNIVRKREARQQKRSRVQIKHNNIEPLQITFHSD